MQSDRTVQTRHDPRVTQPLAVTRPAEPEEAHEVHEEHIHLPPTSVWPISLAGGVALAGLGLVTAWPLTALGLVLGFVAIVSWVQELRHELH